MVHPITGERLSSRAVLSADRLEETSQGEQFAVADLRVSEVRGTDFVGPNQEQLRLRHPTDVGQPSILMMLAGLEVFQRGEALVPRLQALASQVNYELWVWTSPDGGAVEGKVSFSALELDEIPVGVTGRLQTSVKIGAQGLVSARLPPGTYRVRVDPSLASGRSSVETTVTVWPPLSDDAGSQGGQVLIAPETATVGGDVVFLRSNPPTGTSVRLTGARDATRPSASQRPFFPRSVDTLIEGRVFELTGVDCGSCNAALGALYILRVAPPEKTGLPWWVGLGLTVSRPDVRLEPIQLNVPVLQPGRLEAAALEGLGEPDLVRRPRPTVLGKRLHRVEHRLIRGPAEITDPHGRRCRLAHSTILTPGSAISAWCSARSCSSPVATMVTRTEQ